MDDVFFHIVVIFFEFYVSALITRKVKNVTDENFKRLRGAENRPHPYNAFF